MTRACPRTAPQAPTGARLHEDGTTAAPRSEVEARWLEMTRTTLPALAAERGWPVSADHCFQRILLDNATGGVWYDAIPGRPAYRHADDATLWRALALADAAVAGDGDLAALNARSLAWRRARGSGRR